MKSITWKTPLTVDINQPPCFQGPSAITTNLTAPTFVQAKGMLDNAAPTRVPQKPRPIGTSRLAQNYTPFKQMATTLLQLMSVFTNTTIKRPLQLHPTKHYINHIYNDVTGKGETIDSLLRGKDAIIWNGALVNEWGRLANRNKYGVKGTNTIIFIPKSELPPNAKVTYATFVCDERPLKPEPNRVRIVAGGDKLQFNDDAGSPATDLLETKLIVNSTISDSDKGAFFISSGSVALIGSLLGKSIK